jgi:AcrR family transcriptional regulator
MSSPTGAPRTLRDRKRDRTRKALVDAAVELFELNGYHGTTIADIAAAADIGTRTFFGYFASKEEVLFPDTDGRVDAALTAIANREPGDRPVDVLLRALRDVAGPEGQPDDMVDRLTALRVRLIRTVPAVGGRALQIQLDAQRDIANHLQRAFPNKLDDVTAAALVGAFVGAVNGALQVLLDNPSASDDPDQLRQQLHHATDIALRPWR